MLTSHPIMLPPYPSQTRGWGGLGREAQGGHSDAHSPAVLAAPAVPPAMPPSCQTLLDAQALPELPQRNWALSQACAPYQRLCPPEGALHTCTPLSAQLCRHRLQECREWALAPPGSSQRWETLQ